MADELSQQAIAEDLYTKVEDYRGSSMSRLYNDIWNQNQVPYIIGYADAAKALESYKQDKLDNEYENQSATDSGVFAAIGLVQAYYRTGTDAQVPAELVIDPEKLAHEVSLIRAKHVIGSLSCLSDNSVYGIDSEDELTNSKISQIQQELKDKYNFK